jgi:hypothetical protein
VSAGNRNNSKLSFSLIAAGVLVFLIVVFSTNQFGRHLLQQSITFCNFLQQSVVL